MVRVVGMAPAVTQKRCTTISTGWMPPDGEVKLKGRLGTVNSAGAGVLDTSASSGGIGEAGAGPWILVAMIRNVRLARSRSLASVRK